MEYEQMTYEIRGAIFSVFRELGPGLLESVYETALEYELKLSGYGVKTQVGLPVQYKGISLELGFRIDIVVDDLVIVEVKSVEALHDVHWKQLLTYLKLSRKKVGFLVNFNSSKLEDKVSLIRVVN